MADLQKIVSIIFEGQDKVSSTLAGINEKLGAVGDKFEQTGSDAVKAAGLYQDAAGKWRNALGQFATDAEKAAAGVEDIGEKSGQSSELIGKATDAMKALAAAVVVKEFIDANVAYEQFIKTMEMSTGSTEDAVAEWEYIKDLANKLGTEVTSTADAYAKFSSAASGTALEGEAAREIFEAFAGTMASTGASAADVSGAMTQLAQGVSKGKFELDDLKSIAERIPGFFGDFANSLGVSTDELYDLISAGEIGGPELLAFAQDANDALSGVDFDGFVNASNRFKNSLTDAYITLGETGAFDVLTKGVEAGTAAIVGAVAAFTLLGEIAGAVAGAIATGDFTGLGDAIDTAMTKAADKTRDVRDRLFELGEETKKAGDASTDAGDKIDAGMKKGAEAAVDMTKASGDVDKALKALGVDPKQFKDPIDEIIKAFESLASNPAIRGDQFLAGLTATLQKIKDDDDINRVWASIEDAFQTGRISADEYAAAIELLDKKQNGTLETLESSAEAGKKNADALKKQADEAKRAEEETRKYALELEKLASNERIALIEARVQLNVAQLQADTEKVKAAFTSVDNTISESSKLAAELFSVWAGVTDLQKRWFIEDAIERELDLREKAIEKQNEMLDAQIEYMEAQTQRLKDGNALIEIDGSGLQPHLEAFMWEILRAIQVRVNADGLDLLVGA